jgi:predicted  nucleic acid-binding Zn ribbon protein
MKEEKENGRMFWKIQVPEHEESSLAWERSNQNCDQFQLVQTKIEREKQVTICQTHTKIVSSALFKKP